MKSRWQDEDVASMAGDDLALRVHTSRLLGAEPGLVLHGGGNTSVKGTTKDFFGDEVEVLWVKGSGWDLKTIEKPGFAPLRLDGTLRLAELETLGDDDMARELRNLLLDQRAPGPSVEAILHALLPFKFVDHTHTDAVVTLSNTEGGPERIAELFPDCLVLPYVMPGFILARQVRAALLEHDLRASGKKGIILLHHGVFTFADDARKAYEDMIELVTRAEEAIAGQVSALAKPPAATTPFDALGLARIRRAVSDARGSAQIAWLDDRDEARAYASRDDIASLATRGPITPDHVIRTKRIPVILPPKIDEGATEVTDYVTAYEAYFEEHRTPELKMLDPAPRAGVWRSHGTIAFGSTPKECGIIRDIARHTSWATQTGEALGGWKALSPAEIFELEYWILEQAKLGKKGTPPPHLGRVAIVTGAASGIGRATFEQLLADGACVVGLDVAESVKEIGDGKTGFGLVCDLRDRGAIDAAVEQTVHRFGGVDIVVSCAGIFETGQRIEDLGDAWERTLEVNLTGTQRLLAATIPFLKLGVDPAIVLIGSRNVPGPGAGAAAYSVSKAGLTQLGRVAALELAGHGVRVNTIHPDAVFDTGLWSEEALERSAERYGMSVEDYKTKNLLGKTIRSSDVARMVSTVAGPVFGATTGSQIPLDGGSDRVI